MAIFGRFLVGFERYPSAILRVYFVFQISSVHPTVLFSADGPNIVQRFFIRYIHHPQLGYGATLTRGLQG